VLIKRSYITSTGFRLNPVTGDFPGVMAPMNGVGLNLQGNSRTFISESSISGNFAQGILRARDADLDDDDLITFDNNRRNELPAPMMPTPPTM
jgi:hypothetical protein